MKNLKLSRKSKSMTQEELGKLVGVQKAAISKYERGEIQPSKDILLKFVEVLGCSIDYLYGITDNSKSTQREFRADSKDRVTSRGNSTNNSPFSNQGNLVNNEEEYTRTEHGLIDSYRSLNKEGQEKIEDYTKDLVASGRYIKIDSHELVGQEKRA